MCVYDLCIYSYVTYLRIGTDVYFSFFFFFNFFGLFGKQIRIRIDTNVQVSLKISLLQATPTSFSC